MLRPLEPLLRHAEEEIPEMPVAHHGRVKAQIQHTVIEIGPEIIIEAGKIRFLERPPLQRCGYRARADDGGFHALRDAFCGHRIDEAARIPHQNSASKMVAGDAAIHMDRAAQRLAGHDRVGAAGMAVFQAVHALPEGLLERNAKPLCRFAQHAHPGIGAPAAGREHPSISRVMVFIEPDACFAFIHLHPIEIDPLRNTDVAFVVAPQAGVRSNHRLHPVCAHNDRGGKALVRLADPGIDMHQPVFAAHLAHQRLMDHVRPGLRRIFQQGGIEFVARYDMAVGRHSGFALIIGHIILVCDVRAVIGANLVDLRS